MEEATELEYLKWFFINADFGPADGDEKMYMESQFEKETGKKVPANYKYE
jgi:hypothetical protein